MPFRLEQIGFHEEMLAKGVQHRRRYRSWSAGLDRRCFDTAEKSQVQTNTSNAALTATGHASHLSSIQ